MKRSFLVLLALVAFGAVAKTRPVPGTDKPPIPKPIIGKWMK